MNQKNFENFRKSQGKNERTCQRMHVQNHAYPIKSRRTYVRKFSNPRLLPLVHISPRIRSIMCTIQFKLFKDHQYTFKVRHHPLFVGAYVIIYTIRFAYMTNNRFTSQSSLVPIKFIKGVSCRLNCSLKVKVHRSVIKQNDIMRVISICNLAFSFH